MIDLDRTGKVPLGDQLVEGLRLLVEEGRLNPGVRLPSVRHLARRLGISPSTVVQAYGRLVSIGIIEARRGSGHFVCRPCKYSDVPISEKLLIEPNDPIGYAANSLDIKPTWVRAGSGFLPVSWYEEAIPPSVIGHIIRRKLNVASSASAQGLTGLRRRLAQKFQKNWFPVTPDQIVTTFGASHAFSLIARSMIRPGDPVFVEDPGYMVLHAQLVSNGARLVSIPRLADGPDLDAIEAAAKIYRPRLFFTQTLFHNPTGGSTTKAKCHHLLMLAERYNFLIVEDDVYGDLASAEALRLAHLDALNRVFYVSSFTKVLCPGLRVGFVAAPFPYVETLVRQKLMDVVSGSAIQEYIVCDVLESGQYTKHLGRIRNKLLQARAGAEEALTEAGVTLEDHDPEGPFLWGHLDESFDTGRLLRDAADKEIWLASGDYFSPTKSHGRHLRFNVAYCQDPRLIRFLDKCRAIKRRRLAAIEPRPTALDADRTGAVDYRSERVE